MTRDQTAGPFQALAAPCLVTVMVVVIWDLTLRLTGVSSVVVPAPLDVLHAIISDRQVLAEATFRTALTAATGLGGSILLGVCAAFAFSQSKLIRTAFYPYAVLLQTVPIIAVAPIVVVTLGRGFHSVAMISMIISLFPVITSTTTGLLQTDADLRELFQLHQASRWQTFLKLQLPSALPYLISGIRIAGGAAVVGAIVGEFFVGSDVKGLGVLIERRKFGLKPDQLYAAVLMSTALGITCFTAITLIGEFFLQRFYGMSLSGTARRR
ncbi:MAG: ABC transporter permease [Planctomycetaceae bacterium]